MPKESEVAPKGFVYAKDLKVGQRVLFFDGLGHKTSSVVQAAPDPGHPNTYKVVFSFDGGAGGATAFYGSFHRFKLVES